MSMSMTTSHAAPIDERKFTWYDDVPGQPYRYGIHDRGEYAVTRRAVDPEAYTLRPGELFVTVKRTELVDGREWPTNVTLLALPVPSGTWERAAAKARQATERQKRHRPPRPIGSVNPILARRRPEPLALGGGPGATLTETPGFEPPLGPAAMIAYLEDKGTTLRLSPDGTQVAAFSSGGGATPEIRDLISDQAPLLRAALAGEPLRCPWSHPAKGPAPEAVVLLLGGSPACAAHASGELGPFPTSRCAPSTLVGGSSRRLKSPKD